MQENKIRIMQHKVHIMGIIFGVLYGYKLNNQLMTHTQLNYDVCEAAHCSYNEMIEAMKSIVEYSEDVKHFLEVRGEI